VTDKHPPLDNISLLYCLGLVTSYYRGNLTIIVLIAPFYITWVPQDGIMLEQDALTLQLYYHKKCAVNAGFSDDVRF
jgi:hypothetical protein